MRVSFNMPHKLFRTLLLLLTLLANLSFVEAEDESTLPSKCVANFSYKDTCDGLSPTDSCSKPLTQQCCDCQEEWGVSFAYCQFVPNLLATPTPTPEPSPDPTATPDSDDPINQGTPTPTPTLVGGGGMPVPDDSECLNGSDLNLDGLVDSTGEVCKYVPGCKKVDLKLSKDEIELDAGKLEKFAWSSYKLLKASPKKAAKIDLKLAERLKKSAKNVIKQLPLKILAVKLNLDLIAKIPDVVVSCPVESECVEIDNSIDIDNYRVAVVKLRAQATRALRRASRLTEKSVAIAAKKTRKLGSNVRKRANNLIDKADALPKVQSDCSKVNQ